MLGLKADSDKLLHIDCLRVIAVLGVVVHHALGYAGMPGLIDLRLMVDLFFVVSGFVIAYVYSERLSGAAYGTFLLRRAARIAPLHWLTLALMLAMAVVTGQLGQGPFDPGCLPANALALHSLGLCGIETFNGPSWSISAELVMYVAAPALFVVAKRPTWALALLAAAAALLLAGWDWTHWTHDGGALRALPSFVFGASLFFGRHWLQKGWMAGWGMTAGALALMVTGQALGQIAAIYMLATQTVSLDLIGTPSRLVRRIAPLGQLTYGVYMLHVPLLTVLASETALRLLSAPAWVMVTLAVMLVVPLAWLTHVAFERPMRDVLNGRIRRLAAKAPAEA